MFKPNGRLGSKKVKTGCMTCRIRHIKCDEKRPSCLKCTTTGRKCDGYQFVGSVSVQTWKPERNDQSQVVYSLERALTTLIANEEEKRAIHFFRAEAAPILSGSLDTNFWNRLVLQVSHAEPAVRLAVMAVGSLFEHMQEKASVPIATNNSIQVLGRRYQFAIQSYNKAITTLRKRIEDDDSAEEVALMTCVLFVCVEFLQGNEAEALSLCDKGSQILRSLPTPGLKSTPAQVTHHSSKDVIIVDDIAPIFARLGVLSALFGQPLEHATQGQDLSHETFPARQPSIASLGDARAALYSLMQRGQVLLRQGMYYKWAPDPSVIQPDAKAALFGLMGNNQILLREDLYYKWAPDPSITQPDAIFAQQARILSDLGIWHQEFSKVDCSADPLASKHDIYASTILWIYYLILSIWMSTCLHKSETAFDAHLSEFASITERVSSLLTTDTASQPLPIFSFEIGIIPPLYFTAIRCRHPTLRRQAVALLRQCPRRENLWEAGPMADIAQRLIEFEERNRDGRGGPTAWPAEHDRAYDTEIGIKVRDARRHGYPIIFQTRPHGLDGDWHFVEEFVSMPPEALLDFPV